MAYNTNVPNASQSPGLFPAQANTNFSRLKTIMGANHKFNDSAAVDDGYHQIIKELPVAAASVPNDATVGQTFVNTADPTNQLWHKDGSNNLWQITPTIPIRAATNFFWNGSAIVFRYQHNVTSVTRVSTGIFTITFTTALPSANYVVSGMCLRDTQAGGFIEIDPNATYSNVVKTTSVQVRCVDGTNAVADQLAVMVIVMGG